METAPIVIDIGTSTTYAGLSGDSEPVVSLSTVYGRPQSVSKDLEFNEIDFFLGDGVYKSNDYNIKFPMEDSVISNFDDYIEYLYTLVNRNLKTTMGTHPFLITVSPNESESSKETLLQIMMETFKVPYFYPASPSQLVLYAYGVTSGIVVDAGECHTHIVPVFECYSFPYYSECLNVGGKHINDILKKALIQRGYLLKPGSERTIIPELKAQMCYISMNPKNIHDVPVKSFMSSDGMEIKLTAQAFLAPEALFKPSIARCHQKGTPELLAGVINKVDEDIRELLATNIVLAGGTTMFPGYEERLTTALNDLVPDIPTKISADPNRMTAAWVGGSIFSSLVSFKELSISNDEYEEVGPSILQYKMY